MRYRIKNRLVIFLSLTVFVIVSCTKPSSSTSPSTPQSPSSKDIISFIFNDINNPTLPNDIVGVINNDSIFLSIPFGIIDSIFIPTISINGVSVSPSSLDKQNFNKAVIYTVKASDSTSKAYTVIVNVQDPEGTLFINSTYPDFNGTGKLYSIDANTGILKWEYTPGVAALGSSPTIFNEVVYTGIGKTITAIDTATRNIKWQFPTKEFNEATPTVVDGTLYANGVDQFLYAINASTGNLKWKYQFGNDPATGGMGSSPTVVKGIVYIGGNDGYIYAIDASTGVLKWKTYDSYDQGSPFYSSPCVVNDILYIGNNSIYLLALNVIDGTIKWVLNTGGSFSSPTVANGVVYIGSDQNKLYAVDANTGTLKWQYYTGQAIEGSPFVSEGIVYVGTISGQRGYFYAIDANNGNLIWTFGNGDDFFSSPVVFNKTIYIASYAAVSALDAKTGILKWKFNTDDRLEEVRSSPSIIDSKGNVYNSGISGSQN